jgi:hypothetical protein
MSMFPIASITATGVESTITFSSIPSTFTHLELRCYVRDTQAVAQSGGFIRFNGDSGSNYYRHWLAGNGATATSGNGGSFSIGEWFYYPGASGTAGVFGSYVMQVLDYSNASKNKTLKALGGYDATGSGWVTLGSGAWFNTAAITSVLFGATTAFAAGSRFDLYGISTANATGA